jgi:tetratricopeptide (TPR) repeat protein
LLNGMTNSEIAWALEPALREGLLQPFADAPSQTEVGYRWAHDRIQQAAYSLISESKRPEIHLRIGRALVERMSVSDTSEKLFEAANHLKAGAELLDSQEEKYEVAELNLRAGRLAKARHAYQSAATYFSAGQALLAADSWECRYDLSFGLYLRRARCEWLVGHFEIALASIDTMLSHARGRLDLAEVYTLKIWVHCSRREFARSHGLGAESSLPTVRDQHRSPSHSGAVARSRGAYLAGAARAVHRRALRPTRLDRSGNRGCAGPHRGIRARGTQPESEAGGLLVLSACQHEHSAWEQRILAIWLCQLWIVAGTTIRQMG